jgi:hypothetical protein
MNKISIFISEAWHYVEVHRAKVPLFLARTRSGNVDVAVFGKVIRSGWGSSPDPDMVEEIENIFRDRKMNESAPPDQTPLHIAIYKGVYCTYINHFAVYYVYHTLVYIYNTYIYRYKTTQTLVLPRHIKSIFLQLHHNCVSIVSS